MRKTVILNLVLVGYLVFAGMAYGQAKDDVMAHKACVHCGMDRNAFDFSRMLIEYNDGVVSAVCSIHCAAIDLANYIDKTSKSIKVADFNEKHLIDAEKVFWVVGGNKPGVMSRRGKWAFENKDEAESFIKTNKGQLTSFEETMKMAFEDMYEDTKMIRQKREIMRKKSMDIKS